MTPLIIWILLTMSSSLMARENCQDNDCEELVKYCETKNLETHVEKLCKLHFEHDITVSENVNNTLSSRAKKKQKPSPSSVWGYGVLCVTIISLMSVMGVSFIPLMAKSFYDKLLTTLIGESYDRFVRKRTLVKHLSQSKQVNNVLLFICFTILKIQIVDQLNFDISNF